jgi:Transposase DDE domain
LPLWLRNTAPSADSLREICSGLACCLGRLVHLGISKAPSRSTLSYANEHRPSALFEDLFWTALARFRDQQGLGARKHKFRFKNKLLSLDSTTISLCLTMFPWAQFRRAKGGVKAHVLLDHDDYLPAYVLLTEAKRSDLKLADSFSLNPGSIVTMDRGYTDYALFGRWTMAGVFFVTRMKDNAVFTVAAEFEVPQNRNIRADQIIQLTGLQAQTDCPGPLRRVVVWDTDNEREIVLLTNLLDSGATTIAAVYKDRWKTDSS